MKAISNFRKEIIINKFNDRTRLTLASSFIHFKGLHDLLSIQTLLKTFILISEYNANSMASFLQSLAMSLKYLPPFLTSQFFDLL